MNYKQWLKQNKDCNVFSFENKSRNTDILINYMLNRTQSMFRYNGLPDTIPKKFLELYLQSNGNACITMIDESLINTLPDEKRELTKPGLYCFFGSMGSELNEYYLPTKYTIANPWLNYTGNLTIDKDCIVIPNDSLYYGLLPMFRKYASLIVENELSLYLGIINTRISSLLSASDDSTQKSAIKFLNDIKDGKLGIIADPAFLDGIKSQPYITSGNANILGELIEMEQYIKASWFNELGLNANFNMKREALNSSESSLNDDILLPLIDDMLQCRKDGLEKVNKMFGTNISVELSSSWEDNQIDINNEQKQGGNDNNGSESNETN